MFNSILIPIKGNKNQWLEFQGTLGFLFQLADRKGWIQQSSPWSSYCSRFFNSGHLNWKIDDEQPAGIWGNQFSDKPKSSAWKGRPKIGSWDLLCFNRLWRGVSTVPSFRQWNPHLFESTPSFLHDTQHRFDRNPSVSSGVYNLWDDWSTYCHGVAPAQVN